MSTDEKNPLLEMAGSLTHAMVLAHDNGVDAYSVTPRDADDQPLGIGLICLDPAKAARIVELMKTMEAEDADREPEGEYQP